MRNASFATAIAVALVGCGSSNDRGANQSAPKAATPKKKIPYCFFTNDDMKGWSAKRGADGNIIVKGKVYREDSRYQAVLAPATISGTRAEVWPDLQQNGGPYGAPGDWWDVTQTIAGSAAVDTLDVTCGGKPIAHFEIKPKG